MIIPEMLPRIDCPLPNVVVIGFAAVGAAIAGFLAWLSVFYVRRKFPPRIRFGVAIVIVVILTVWAGQVEGSEPVLVSGMLNPGIALLLMVVSLALSLFAIRVKKREPRLAALLFSCGAAIVLGATLGWTWRSQQPCKHPTVRAETKS